MCKLQGFAVDWRSRRSDYAEALVIARMREMISKVYGLGREFAVVRFGGRAAMLKYGFTGLFARVGGYRRWRSVDWLRVERLVFVCAGNICRSAFAESYARQLGLPAVSIGLDTRGGDGADPKAIAAGLRRDVDMTKHVSSRSHDFKPQTGDLLLAMEPWQATLIQTQLGDEQLQISLLGLCCEPFRPLLPDPLGRPDAYFDRCFGWIKDCIDGVARRIDDQS